MSISPDCSAVKRSLALSGVYFTFEASPNRAAATARHASTSIPFQLPLSSLTENPGNPVLTPHCTKPFFLTASKVAPAVALPAATTPATATASREIRFSFITFSPLALLRVWRSPAPSLRRTTGLRGDAHQLPFKQLNHALTTDLWMWFTLIPAFLRAVLVVNVRMHHDGSRIARRPARLLRTQVLAG